ncbi:predicted protein [Sparassis crispa]|uniref:Uncharacterized protein n=1 Tax=Sparassis crispa TaxID=139825 RepID=A0A401GAG6_9APHY|nr:predicted protein [Sparassis crispa]GBE79165.1 predicted protein [Sparassis crispa]
MQADFDRSLFRSEPTAEDILAANAQIQKHELTITSIQSQMNQLMLDLQRLRKEQLKHVDEIRFHKGIISLARRIPEELLSKIFEHCIEDGWTRAPIVVGHVCSMWRLATRAPRVWSRVYVDCDSPVVVDRLRFWLSRACSSPLHITITASSMVASSTFTNVMAILGSRADQWRSLSIDIPTLYELSSCIQECDFNMNNLAELWIRVEILRAGNPNDNNADALELKSFFRLARAPKLHAIRYTCNVIPSIPIFPSHIRDLHLTTFESPIWRPLSAASLFVLLEDLPELQCFTMSMPLMYARPFVPVPDFTRTVTLSKLESLTMYGPTDLNGLLSHLLVPALRRLHLRSLEDLGYRQHSLGPSLLRLIENSVPPLELLELHDVDLSPEYFARCFTATPVLRELRLHESSISDATLNLLNGPSGLCPRLTRLDMRWCGLLRGTALVDLVRSRHVEPGAPSGEVGVSKSDLIAEVAVINCCFVGERDVLDLARMTTCRVVMRDGDDYCQ